MLLQGRISSILYSHSVPAREGGGIVFQQFNKLIQLIMMSLLGTIQGWEGKGKCRTTVPQKVHSHTRWVWTKTIFLVMKPLIYWYYNVNFKTILLRQPEDEWKALCFDQNSVGLKQQQTAFQSIFSTDCSGSWTYLQLRALKYLQEKSYKDSRRNLIHKYQNAHSRWLTLRQMKTLLGMLSDFRFSSLLVEVC